MIIGSLCSGVGGLELGLERAGVGRTVWQVEIDPFCRAVLARHWPDAVRFDDLRDFNPPPADVICGGFPCQPASVAGNRKGINDERWLWPYVHRVIRMVRPRGVVLENVPGLLTVGGGRPFGGIIGDMAALRYDAEWHLLSAADVGAPHKRERLFIIAVLADPDMQTRDRQPNPDPRGIVGIQRDVDRSRCVDWRHNRVAQSGVGRGVDGVPGGVDVAHRWPADRGSPQHPWEAPRTCGRQPLRAQRLKALGNAVVPQCAEIAGWRLLDLMGRAGHLQPTVAVEAGKR